MRSSRLLCPFQSRRGGVTSMATGTVKWFNADNGNGFIVPDYCGSKDLFVHNRAIADECYKDLEENEKVENEADEGEKGPGEKNVTLVAVESQVTAAAIGSGGSRRSASTSKGANG